MVAKNLLPKKKVTLHLTEELDKVLEEAAAKHGGYGMKSYLVEMGLRGVLGMEPIEKDEEATKE